MNRRVVGVLVLIVIWIGVGCKDTDSSAQGGITGDKPISPEIYKPSPWPPPGAQPAKTPPAVERVMELAVNAFARQDASQLKKLFIDRAGFMGMSDCDQATVKQVFEGVDTSVEQMDEYGGNVQWRGFSEGYLQSIARGSKPHRTATCRAKMDVELFQGRYRWQVHDTILEGEAHLIRAKNRGAWRFVRLGALD